MAPLATVSGLGEFLRIIQTTKTLVFTERNHADLHQIEQIFLSHNETCTIHDLSSYSEKDVALIRDYLQKYTGWTALPLIFIKGDCVGDLKHLKYYNSKEGLLKNWLEKHDYDIIVIGGGSGGLAASKAAAEHGKTVAVLDFVTPSPLGTSWGLGGTCVNVGCIPKKLMHQAALLGKAISDARKYGWQLSDEVTHNWDTMKGAIQDHIASLNWGYRVQLREKNVTYVNAKGSFVGSHTIKAVDKRGKEKLLTADRFILATGLRPRYLDIPGAKEYCITSDDLFSLPYCPGKTLCVGASYVALECAGFLRGIGLEVHVMVRSILLRGFDQQMAERVGEHMESIGIKFFRGPLPIKIEKVQEGTPGLLRVTSQSPTGETVVEEYNTVLLAIGRDALTDELALDAIGVERNIKNKKIIDRFEQSTIPYIYAIGDILDGKPELTPMAIQAGKLLARRLCGVSSEQADYINVPTTVFTPLEYGCCGYTEEDAIAKFGADNIEVYHTAFRPLEYTIPGRDLDASYAKLICRKDEKMRVVGFHVLGPNAGEVTQGFAIALKFRATKEDFDSLVGIHPTCAETFTTLSITKREQADVKASGC